MYDAIVVGAGISGLVAAEQLANRGRHVLIIEKRDHIGGNCYDYQLNGVCIHKYGPHIFHTNNERSFTYLSQFTEWQSYEHRVKALVGDRKVDLPVNLNSIEQLYPRNEAAMLIGTLLDYYQDGATVTLKELRAHESPRLQALAEDLWLRIYLGYSEKQWGQHVGSLDSSVFDRMPIRVSRDSRFFTDKYQGLPAAGYAAMFNRMVENNLIDIRLGEVDTSLYRDVYDIPVVYTGSLDEFYGYSHDVLPYRSVRIVNKPRTPYNGGMCAPVVNMPDHPSITRITDYAQLTEATESTVYSEERPEEYDGDNERMYPINNDACVKKYLTYRVRAEQQKNLYLIGRLAEYRYYNMDEAVARALEVVGGIK